MYISYPMRNICKAFFLQIFQQTFPAGSTWRKITTPLLGWWLHGNKTVKKLTCISYEHFWLSFNILSRCCFFSLAGWVTASSIWLLKNDKFCKPINMLCAVNQHDDILFSCWVCHMDMVGRNKLGVWRARERKNEKWKLIYIWTMLNMNDWLQSFFRTALFTFSSTHLSSLHVFNFYSASTRVFDVSKRAN